VYWRKTFCTIKTVSFLQQKQRRSLKKLMLVLNWNSKNKNFLKYRHWFLNKGAFTLKKNLKTLAQKKHVQRYFFVNTLNYQRTFRISVKNNKRFLQQKKSVSFNNFYKQYQFSSIYLQDLKKVIYLQKKTGKPSLYSKNSINFNTLKKLVFFTLKKQRKTIRNLKFTSKNQKKTRKNLKGYLKKMPLMFTDNPQTINDKVLLSSNFFYKKMVLNVLRLQSIVVSYKRQELRQTQNLLRKSLVQTISRFDLILKANASIGLVKKGLGIFRFYRYRFKYKPYRYQLDNVVAETFFTGLYKPYYEDLLISKNKFWISDKYQEDELTLIWQRYRYMKSWQPYLYIDKKYKIFFNWTDRWMFFRFPLYRRKYPVLFYYPQYTDYRRLFKNQLQEQHLFRWLYRLKYSQFVNQFKKAVSGTKRVFELMYLNFYEMRMDAIAYRLNFAFSIKQAKQWANRGFFMVNSKPINWYSYHVSVGDVIMPIPLVRYSLLKKTKWWYDMGESYMNLRLFYRQIQADQYPTHLMLNERIPAGMVISNPDPHKIRHHRPFSIQFLTLSLNKYS
jgi:hypothetical protein